MVRSTLACLLAVGLLSAAPAQAGPSLLGGGSTTANFFGTSGLLFTPDAYTIGERGVGAHVHAHADFESYGVLFGPDRRIEVGISFLNGERGFGSDGIIGNVKAQLLSEGTALPAVSVGVVDAFDQFDRSSSWYVVGSKDLTRIVPLGLFPIRAHLGYGGGLYENEFFAGAEMNLGTPLDFVPVARPSFSVLAETSDGNVNVGLRGRFRGFSASVGLFDFDDFGGGISYTTGLRLR